MAGCGINPVGATIGIGCNAALAALELANGAAVTADAVNICAMGEVRGNGTMTADVTNSGSIRPGASPGTLSIAGAYQQTAGGTLHVELAALSPPGTGFDVVIVTGTATLGGTLSISQVSPFVAAVGNQFAILTSGGGASGSFASVNGVPGTCGTLFTATTAPAGVTLEAEYDGNLPDCNANSIPDPCDLLAGTSLDCNTNSVPDECDIASTTSLDCNANGVPDECDIASGGLDCNVNGIPDSCDIASGASSDLNGNTIPDDCETFDPGDVNGDGVVDVTDLLFVIGAWGSCTPGVACPGDIAPAPDGDGQVNVTDLLAVIANWG